MANAEHVAILEQGVEVWNQWRKEKRNVRPDLSEADLNDANLSGINLSDANLSGADLIEATIMDADLNGVNLSDANLGAADLTGTELNGANLHSAHLVESVLYGAKLRRADLSNANLEDVNLEDANLRRADLSDTNLRRGTLRAADLSDSELIYTSFGEVNLHNADFTDTKLCYTTFSGVDLSRVRGLETIEHVAPSYVDIQTIYLSCGNIPESFLRGAGVPDNFIAYMKSLSGKAFEFYSCFISYSSQDEVFAQRLYNDLQGKGVRCWFAPKDMKIGDEIRPSIDQAIRVHDKVLLVLSTHSMNSRWVQKEVEAAFEQESQQKKPLLFPIRIDEAVMKTEEAWAADIRRTKHIGDFTQWKQHDAYQQAFTKLLQNLKSQS